MRETKTRAERRTSAAELQETLDPTGEPEIRMRQTEGGLPWESNHPINLRLSFPFIFGRYYLTIVGGKERRALNGASMSARIIPWRRRQTSRCSSSWETS